MRKVILISLIFITILSISAISAADNDTSAPYSTILNNTDKIETIEACGNTFDDIQKTINDAESNSTIILNGSYTGLDSEIKIYKDITLEGINNATLDGHNSTKILDIEFGNVILKNINFINSNSITNGGAIFSNGNLTVINCTFTNNAVNAYYDWYFETHKHNYELEEIGKGGAIYANNDLSIINSSFIRNSAVCKVVSREMDMYYINNQGSASAIYCKGRLQISKSKFALNDDYVIIANDYSEINQCTFENQTRSFANYGANVTFTQSSFINCGSDIYGYEIYVDGENINIIGCNFTNSNMILYTWGNCEITNSIFSNNKATYSENNIIDIRKHGKITNSTFINNHAKDTAIMSLSTYELSNCTFINNSDATILTEDLLLDDSLKSIYLFEIKIVNKLSKVYYSSGKIVSVKLVNIKSNQIKHYWDYDVYRNGKKFYDYWNGYMMEFPVSTWKVGTYTIVVKPTDSFTLPEKLTFKITILKAKTIVKAPKITAKYKKSKYFKITVKNTITKKVAKNLKIKVKVYTGKKYKTYTLKTDKKGVAKLNTKSLKIGKHKVVVSSGNNNYNVSAKSQITIKK